MFKLIFKRILVYICSMNKTFKILLVLIITTLYCFVISAVNHSFIDSEYNKLITSQHKNTYSDFSNTHFYHTFQTESSVSNNSLPSTNLKNQFFSFWAIHKTHEQVIKSEYLQYVLREKNNLIHYRKSDIIFPFHYFW
jgi:hypothetical protein